MQRLVQDLLTYSRVGTKGKELLKTSGGGLASRVRTITASIEYPR